MTIFLKWNSLIPIFLSLHYLYPSSLEILVEFDELRVSQWKLCERYLVFFREWKNLREFYYWDTILWVYQILGLKCSRFNGPTCAPLWTEIRRQYSMSFCRTTGIRQYSATLRLFRSWTKFTPRLVDLRSRAVSFESRPYFCGCFHKIMIVQA